MGRTMYGIKLEGVISKTLYGTVNRYNTVAEAKKLAERLMYKDYEIVPLKIK